MFQSTHACCLAGKHRSSIVKPAAMRRRGFMSRTSWQPQHFLKPPQGGIEDTCAAVLDLGFAVSPGTKSVRQASDQCRPCKPCSPRTFHCRFMCTFSERLLLPFLHPGLALRNCPSFFSHVYASPLPSEFAAFGRHGLCCLLRLRLLSCTGSSHSRLCMKFVALAVLIGAEQGPGGWMAIGGKVGRSGSSGLGCWAFRGSVRRPGPRSQ